jgi:hypothetical protein
MGSDSRRHPLDPPDLDTWGARRVHIAGDSRDVLVPRDPTAPPVTDATARGTAFSLQNVLQTIVDTSVRMDGCATNNMYAWWAGMGYY